MGDKKVRSTNKAILATPALLSLCAIAGAEQTPMSGLSIRAGVSMLSTKASRDLTQDSSFAVGAGYQLNLKGMGATGGTTSLDADWYRNTGNGNKIDVWSVTLMQRFASPAKAAGMNVYFGAGIGWHRAQVYLTGSTPVSETKNTVGGTALVGTNFGENAFLELAYHFSATVLSTNVNSFTAMVGVKF